MGVQLKWSSARAAFPAWGYALWISSELLQPQPSDPNEPNRERRFSIVGPSRVNRGLWRGVLACIYMFEYLNLGNRPSREVAGLEECSKSDAALGS
jgi:hypothetical protein